MSRPTLPRWDHALLFVTAVGCACALWWLVTARPAWGQTTLSIVAGEIRHGQHGRQDQIGLELGASAGPVRLYVETAARHGNVDDGNSGLPWVTLLAGHSVGPLGLYGGVYAAPMDYSRWSFLGGPRLDVPVGHRVTLHLSHLWRARGLVRERPTRWTPRTTIGLALEVLR